MFETEVVVVVHIYGETQNQLIEMREDVIVLDLANNEALAHKENYQGVLW